MPFKKTTYSVSKYDTWQVYIKLSDLRYNISKLVLTNEVTQIQRTKLREYMRTLKRRTDKLEEVLNISFNN